MKRLLLCLIFGALPLYAQANGDLARQWGVEASRLSTETFGLIHAMDTGQNASISDIYALDIHRFGRTSSELARWVDQTNGPHDLGCIFRGMATEAADQLSTLEETSNVLNQRESLGRLATMFADAEIIAIAAQRPSTPVNAPLAATKMSCSADAQSVLDHLR